jgi:hypothetical protein
MRFSRLIPRFSERGYCGARSPRNRAARDGAAGRLVGVVIIDAPSRSYWPGLTGLRVRVGVPGARRVMDASSVSSASPLRMLRASRMISRQDTSST